MEIIGDCYNKEPKTIEIFVVAYLDRTYGHSKYYAYFTTEEKAQAWLDKHNNGLGGNLEVAKIVVA